MLKDEMASVPKVKTLDIKGHVLEKSDAINDNQPRIIVSLPPAF